MCLSKAEEEEASMAERRMFAKTIIDSDAFLDMPHSTQLLYFHLSMRADDDGFINNPKSIMRNAKCNEDDIKLLCAKKFVIPFESGVVVIKHWKIHNYIAKDRYKETKYKEEKATLSLDENNVYTQALYTDCIQTVDELDTQVRLGKDRLGKDSKYNKRFVPPSMEDVQGYITEKGYSVDAERFIDYYTANGWKVGKNSMKDWKAAVRNWERNNGHDFGAGKTTRSKLSETDGRSKREAQGNRYKPLPLAADVFAPERSEDDA